MASTRIHIDEARLGRVQKQDRIATGVLTAIVAIVMLIVVSMVAYILFEGISTLFQPGFLTQPARANGTQGGVLYQLFDSFYLLLITLGISVPISLGGAVFLVEYAPDGPIRDIDEIGNWDFPVYCTGTTPGGPYKEGPGEINVPIACGGVSVNPGDIILADPDGVIVIPRKDAPVILEDAKKFQAADEKKLAAAKNGTANRAWVEKSLAEKGYEIIDDVYHA